MHLPAAPSDTQILDLIDAWIADLARGDYACAHARTAHDAYYGWTPAASNALTARMVLRRLPKRAIPCP